MRILRLSFAFVIVLGCGDDTQPSVDAHGDAVDAPVDAPPADANDAMASPTCAPASIIDLDSVATEAGGVKTAYYVGTTVGAARDLEPAMSCSNGPGGAPERAHHFTAPSSPRVRVIASTDEADTDLNYDTVVYLRASCTDPASQLACSDDDNVPGPRPLGSRASVEMAAGTAFDIIVDGYDEFSFGTYGLRVRAVPALPQDTPCDPTGAMNACRTGLICTSAGTGSPHCAPGTPPTISQLVAQTMQNGRTVRAYLAGGDVDGDAIAAHFDFLDAGGSVVASAERGLGSAVSGQTSFGPLVVYSQDGFVDRFPLVTTARAWLIDAAGLMSSSLDASLVPIAVRDLGQACDPAGLTDQCRGELACTSSQCAVTAAAQAACGAAPTVMDSMTLTGSLATTMGTFESGCAFSRNLDDRVYRVVLARNSDLVITTDLDPSAATLDTVVYLRTTCTDPASQIACNDNVDTTDARSRLSLTDVPAGTYFAFVDGSRNGAGYIASGPFGAQFEIIPIVGAGEPCGSAVDGGVPVGRCASGLSCISGTCQ